MINIKNLSVQYRNKGTEITAIEDINVKVEKGDICAIIGPSGGGKSTLLKVLAGIIKDYKGEVLVDGKEVNPRTNRIGFIPQNYGLVRWKTAEDNIFLSARIKDGKRHVDRDFYEKILDELKIKDLKNRYPSELSGGQQQRVSIARALLLKPNLLLMDESFSALDAMTREEVQKLFLAVWNEHKVTTLLVTHDIREAMYLGKKIIIFSSLPGKVMMVLDNPFFGKSFTGLDREYGKFNDIIIKALKGEKINEIKGI